MNMVTFTWTTSHQSAVEASASFESRDTPPPTRCGNYSPNFEVLTVWSMFACKHLCMQSCSIRRGVPCSTPILLEISGWNGDPGRRRKP